jgi:hypothetical protein
MTCLQKSLIPILTCDPTCSSIKTGAFASHTPCYVTAGICNLAVDDWKVISAIVGMDSRTYGDFNQIFAQMAGTGGACIPTIFSRFESEIGQLVQELPQAIKDAEAEVIEATINELEIIRAYIERFGKI